LSPSYRFSICELLHQKGREIPATRFLQEPCRQRLGPKWLDLTQRFVVATSESSPGVTTVEEDFLIEWRNCFQQIFQSHIEKAEQFYNRRQDAFVRPSGFFMGTLSKH
jgi:hypothetical protein